MVTVKGNNGINVATMGANEISCLTTIRNFHVEYVSEFQEEAANDYDREKNKS